MRIRRLEIHDLRNFRGKHVLDFSDPVTGEARDRVVLVGSNGSGKTTVFDVVEAMLRLIEDPVSNASILHESRGVKLTVELSYDLEAPSDGASRILTLVWGKKPPTFRSSKKPEWLGPIPLLGGPMLLTNHLARDLRKSAQTMVQGRAELSGGLIYFPHDRELRPVSGGPIAPPPVERSWISRYAPTNQWNGSLEQLWVWQNYLDLERKNRGEETNELAPSVELLQEALGPGRKVFIREGRVRVTTPWNDASGKPAEVLLDQLPSGERQCVMLLGELVRRKRPHGVLFIDEPEISLHPTLQRQLVAQLRRVARMLDMQVFFATHSAEIVRAVRRHEVLSLDHPDMRFDLPVDEDSA